MQFFSLLLKLMKIVFVGGKQRTAKYKSTLTFKQSVNQSEASALFLNTKTLQISTLRILDGTVSDPGNRTSRTNKYLIACSRSTSNCI